MVSVSDIESIPGLSFLWNVLSNLLKVIPENIRESIKDRVWKPILKKLRKDIYSRIKEKIRNRYISDSKIVGIFGGKHDIHDIDKIFVNVAVLKREYVERLERETLREKKAMWDTYEDNIFEKPYTISEPVKLEEIVKLAEKNGKVRGLILGKAGIGKSTLCRYVCRKWAQRELWNEFELVVLLETKKWNGGIVPSIVNSYCNKEEVESYLKTKEELLEELKRKKVLLIIDGLDEVNEKMREEIKEELAKADISYIITSRPQGIEGDIIFHQRFENIGFRDEDIEKYIRRYFEEKGEIEKGEKLIEFIKENSIAFAVSHIPVMLEIMCHLWLEDALSAPFTVTELYDRAAKLIVEKNMEKRLEIDRHSRDFTRKLEIFCDAYSSVAHAAFKKEEILIPRERVEEAISNSECSIKELLKLGLIRESSYAGEEYYYFHHLTVQEFFMARYIAKNYTKEKLVEFIREEKFNPRYRRVLLFLVGLFNKDEEKLNLLFSTLKDEPRDLAGIYLLTTTLEMLGEVRELNVLKSVNVGEIVEEAQKEIMSIVYDRHVVEALKLTHPEIRERMLNPMVEFVERYKSANTVPLKFLSYLPISKIIHIFGLLGKNQEKVSKVLLEILKDKELKSEYRAESAEALGKLGVKNEIVINTLLDILTNREENVSVRWASAHALAALEVKEDRVINTLLDILTDIKEDWHLRVKSIYALMNLRVKEDRVTKALGDIITDVKENIYVRVHSISGLANLEIEEEKIKKRIINAINNVITNYSDIIKPLDIFILEESLAKLIENNEKVINTLLDIAKNKEEFWISRSLCIGALGTLKSKDKRVVDTLIKILSDTEEDVIICEKWKVTDENLNQYFYARSAAAIALAQLDVDDRRIIDIMIKILENKYKNEDLNRCCSVCNENLRSKVAIALGELRADDERVGNTLLNIVKNRRESSDIRKYAMAALSKLSKGYNIHYADTSNILIEIIKDSNEYAGIRELAFISLVDIGVEIDKMIEIIYYLIKEDKMEHIDIILNTLPFKTLLSALREIKDERIYKAILAKAREKNIPVFKRGNKLCAIENGIEVCKEIE